MIRWRETSVLLNNLSDKVGSVSKTLGLWDEEVQQVIRPMHDALVALLQRHLGLAAADEDLQRLAICVSSLGVHQHVGCDVTEQLAPGLYRQPESFDRWSRLLVRSALAMVEAERRHRAGEEPTA